MAENADRRQLIKKLFRVHRIKININPVNRPYCRKHPFMRPDTVFAYFSTRTGMNNDHSVAFTIVIVVIIGKIYVNIARRRHYGIIG